MGRGLRDAGVYGIPARVMQSFFRPDILAGKVAFVTGGGSGICNGIARALLEHGASVAIAGRKEERLLAAAEELSKSIGGKVLATPLDVRDPARVEAALDRANAELGKIDILVNGAAGNFLAPAAALSYNGFKTVLDIDSIGTFNVSKATFDRSLKDRGGVILNISATLHYGATPLQIHASAAKAAVDSITRSLALEWGSLGIRVVGIAPGPIDDTEGMTRLLPPGMRTQLEQSIAIKRFGRIEEIARLSVFLCSDAASLITGTTVVADGGASLGNATMGFQ
jgi:2,4-dienoyl-CoA reductase [(3E)-enoyl-CoA-producing], peroxisomal